MVRQKSARKNLSEEARLAKNARIKATYNATRARRAKMECFTRKLKIDRSHLNRKQKEAIARLNRPGFCSASYTGFSSLTRV